MNIEEQNVYILMLEERSGQPGTKGLLREISKELITLHPVYQQGLLGIYRPDHWYSYVHKFILFGITFS